MYHFNFNLMNLVPFKMNNLPYNCVYNFFLCVFKDKPGSIHVIIPCQVATNCKILYKTTFDNFGEKCTSGSPLASFCGLSRHSGPFYFFSLKQNDLFLGEKLRKTISS